MHRFILYTLILLCCPALLWADGLPYNDVGWLKLLHYKNVSTGYLGLIDNAEFYVATDGRENPQSEMQAEINAFNNNDKSKCNFPARFEWLRGRGLVNGDLADCAEYQKFIQDTKPDGITLLFTNAYMSNPASLFGHTLLRIDTKRKGTQMLAHGSNFGADSGTEQGFMFAMKGLFGFYFGKYSVNPYWDIINTYNNIENRDIWEYKLNLTPAEEAQFVNHLYELRGAQIQYFFLIKNCSYMILELMEAVRPELNLTADYNYYAIPLDTLKTIKNVPGLIGEVNYRPARYTKIKAELANMNNGQYAAFLAGVNDSVYDMPELDETEQSTVLETLYQYYQYQYTAHKMELKEYRKNSFAVLRRRSQMPVVKEKVISGEDPSLAHDTFELAVNSGINRHQSFTEVKLAPAYTALTSDNYGMIRGSGIEVLSGYWRYYYQKHKAVLQNFTALGITSLVPSDRVFSQISYVNHMAVERIYNAKTNKEGYAATAEFGIGKTYALRDNFWLYGLLKANVAYGGFIPHNQYVGTTPEIGTFAEIGDIRLHLNAQNTFATTRLAKRMRYNATISYGITRNLSLDFTYKASHYQHAGNAEEWLVGLKYYR